MKNLVALLVVGLVLGLVVGFGASKVVQTVKTKTVTVTKISKIENGLPKSELRSHFGAPAQVTSTSQNVTIPAGCAVFVGKTVNGRPAWIVVAC